MSKKQRRRYDPEFKRKAVQFILSGEKGVPEIANDLGIELSSLYRSTRRTLAPHSTTAIEMDEELRQLRRELASVRAQRDV